MLVNEYRYIRISHHMMICMYVGERVYIHTYICTYVGISCHMWCVNTV